MGNENIKYATIKHPLIEALVNDLYRFDKREQAVERLNSLRENFILSKKQHEIDAEKKDNLALWIKGFDVSEQEAKWGYVGNFVIISVEKSKDKKFTLKAIKVESDVNHHPQKKRKKQRHPNWGHPVLRNVKKGKNFNTVQEAQSELNRLHEEFPEVTIPNLSKLYVMIYSRSDNPKKPVQKFVLEIKQNKDEGGVFIEAYQNEYKPTETAKQEATAAVNDNSEEGKEGFFTTLVQLKSKRKNPLQELKSKKDGG